MTEMKALFTQLDGTDRWTDWEVTGSTAALLHTGEAFTGGCHPKSVLYILCKYISDTIVVSFKASFAQADNRLVLVRY